MIQLAADELRPAQVGERGHQVSDPAYLYTLAAA
jgi:hypothetical protein